MSESAPEVTTTDHVALLIEGLDPGALVTRFVVVAEVIDTDGDRAVWTQTHEGSTSWDINGLLTYVLNEVQAGQTLSRLIEAGEDEEDE